MRIFFVDESGTCDRFDENFPETRYFGIGGVVADIASKDCLQSELEGKGVRRSQRIGNNWPARLKLLRDVSKITDFRTFAFVIDKSSIKRESGLLHKKSMYKYCLCQLVKNLKDTYESGMVWIENYGSEDFMTSIGPYFGKKNLFSGTPDMFNEWAFDYMDGKLCNWMRLADFVVGTYIKLKLDEKDDGDRSLCKDILSSRTDFYKCLDDVRGNSSEQTERESEDQKIEDYNFSKAYEILDELRNQEENERAAAELLHILLEASVNEERPVPTERIIKEVFRSSGLSIDERTFRREVIGMLRDKKILLSANNQGIYLAKTLEQVEKTIEYQQRTIVPMVNRQTTILSILDQLGIESKNYGLKIIEELTSALKKAKL